MKENERERKGRKGGGNNKRDDALRVEERRSGKRASASPTGAFSEIGWGDGNRSDHGV